MKKIYAEQMVTSQDAQLIQQCHLLRHFYENKLFDHHKKANKAICDNIRRSLNISNVIGLGLNKEQDTVGVFIYEMEATTDVYYDQHFDEEEKKHFILVQ